MPTRNRPRILLALLLVGLAIGLSGCDRPHAARRHPLYRKGVQHRNEGDSIRAELYFRRFLEKHPGSPEGYLALASLYDESLSNPAAALYFYDEYLNRAAADAWDRADVERYRLLVRAKLLSELSDEPLPVLPEQVLAAENRQLRVMVERMKLAILNLQNAQNRPAAFSSTVPPASAPAATVPATVPAPAGSPLPPGARIYTVRQGDSPSRIAQQFYGAGSKFPLILEANQLNVNSTLRVGQQLIIPPDPN